MTPTDKSAAKPRRKLTIHDFQRMKREGEKIAWLTSYVYAEAYCVEQAGIDLILVGDSGVMTTLGMASTQPATMDEMIMLTKAVRRGAPNTFIVFDMPLGSYEVSPEEAVRNAIRAVKETGADAIKLEQATPRILASICAIQDAGITVFGHLGLTPQSAVAYKVQGNTVEGLERIAQDALLLWQSGVRHMLLEAMPEDSAAYVARYLDRSAFDMVTFGIGAGAKVDGQLLIVSDLLGAFPNFRPRFAKNYVAEVLRAYRPGADDGFIQLATLAIARYVSEVKAGAFPDAAHTYPLKDETLRAWLAQNAA